jgi:hypothetical protein
MLVRDYSRAYVAFRSRDITVGMATDDRKVGSRIFTSPRRPDRLWIQPNLPYNVYRGLFPGGKAAGT